MDRFTSILSIGVVCVQCLKKSTVFLFVITTFLNGVRCINEVVGEYGAALRQPDGFIVFTSSIFPFAFIYLSRDFMVPLSGFSLGCRLPHRQREL